MADIIRIPSTEFVKEIVAAKDRKDGYIMGGTGNNPRTGYLNLAETKVKSSWKVTGWYYTQYDGNPKQKKQALYWRDHATRVWDCAGLAEGVYEILTGICVDTKARYIYAQWCYTKGSGMIPAKYRVPGAAVFWSSEPSSKPSSSNIHHVGYLWKPVNSAELDGDWYIIEARGVMYGVVCTKLYSRKPNFWGLMEKYYDYSGTIVTIPEPEKPKFGSRILRNGDEGDDVKELQTNLIRLGYDCGKWGADGDFGDATEMAVRAFQRDHDLVVDGEFGPKSLSAMERALAELEKPIEETPKFVKIEGGNCYVRTEPNTSGEIRGVAHADDKLPFEGEVSENGWLKVTYKEKSGWVSGKYGKVVAE